MPGSVGSSYEGYNKAYHKRALFSGTPSQSSQSSRPPRLASGKDSPREKSAKCDKCDGNHATDACPHFRKPREKHKDAWANYGAKMLLEVTSKATSILSHVEIA